ncbi:hypothetical protein ACFV6U_05490 [Streptomyces sp. NPDC059810]|uniref:hypothetical protein n=1 Tax=Streptomyces sp. NPDC059810 TaxID=3346956 RepID=UPI003662E324
MTFHEDAAKDLLDDYLADPAGTALLQDAERMLQRASARTEQFSSLIGQTQRSPAYWPRHQVAAFAFVVNELAHGKFVRRRIKVGSTPGPDANREGNAARLCDIKAPFHAQLDLQQNGADSDGTFSWEEPITAWRATGVRVLGAHVLHGTIHAPYGLKPFSVPLEVGYTLPSRTMAHLLVEGAVARWPYDERDPPARERGTSAGLCRHAVALRYPVGATERYGREPVTEKRYAVASVRQLAAVVEEFAPRDPARWDGRRPAPAAAGARVQVSRERARQLWMVVGMYYRAVDREEMPDRARRTAPQLFTRPALRAFWELAEAGELRARAEDVGKPLPLASLRIVRNVLRILAGLVVPERAVPLPVVLPPELKDTVSARDQAALYRGLADLAAAGPLVRDGIGMSAAERARVLAMVGIILDSGSRVGELAALRLDDLTAGLDAVGVRRRPQRAQADRTDEIAALAEVHPSASGRCCPGTPTSGRRPYGSRCWRRYGSCSRGRRSSGTRCVRGPVWRCGSGWRSASRW